MVADWIDVRGAAELLAVAPVRVRQLIAAHILPAERWSGRWRIDRAEVERLAGQERGGRPYAPGVAWQAIALLDPDLRQPSLGREQRARARRYAGEVASGRIAGLRRRARAELGRVHESLLPVLAQRIVVSGAAAIPADDPNRLAGDDLVEGYAQESHWAALADEFGFEPGNNPNVVIHVVEDSLWPFQSHTGTAGAVVGVIDLLEQGDQRAGRAARSILARAGDQR